MQLLSAKQMQQWDARTIAHEPVESLQLMERAAMACVEFLEENNLLDRTIKIFCGKGNNGGDGLAIARLLILKGYDPAIFIVEMGTLGSVDFQANLQRLHSVTTNIHFIQSTEFFPVIEVNNLIIDALLGLGLDRPLHGLYAELVNHINQFKATVVSIDLPTGMFCDKSSITNQIIKANYTLTFQSLKLCFLMAENAPYAGHVSIMNIGLSPEFLNTINTDIFLISESLSKNIYKPRPDFAHKGTCGHALIIAGSAGKMGAAVLCTKACLRAGAGLVTAKVPHNEIPILQISTPEAMCLIEDKIDFEKYQSAGIGPGLGKEKHAFDLLKSLLHSALSKNVIDADALNLIAENPELIELISENAVVTPHPKEFDRLFGEMKNDFERFEKAVALSKKYAFTIVLKGHHTCVAKNGKAFFNLTGNSGMATGGMGDVLTGIITSLMAQGYNSLNAAILGIYLHGLAGDLCLREQSVESLLPADLIDYFGQAFMQFHFPQE